MGGIGGHIAVDDVVSMLAGIDKAAGILPSNYHPATACDARANGLMRSAVRVAAASSTDKTSIRNKGITGRRRCRVLDVEAFLQIFFYALARALNRWPRQTTVVATAPLGPRFFHATIYRVWASTPDAATQIIEHRCARQHHASHARKQTTNPIEPSTGKYSSATLGVNMSFHIVTVVRQRVRVHSMVATPPAGRDGGEFVEVMDTRSSLPYSTEALLEEGKIV